MGELMLIGTGAVIGAIGGFIGGFLVARHIYK